MNTEICKGLLFLFLFFTVTPVTIAYYKTSEEEKRVEVKITKAIAKMELDAEKFFCDSRGGFSHVEITGGPIQGCFYRAYCKNGHSTALSPFGYASRFPEFTTCWTF